MLLSAVICATDTVAAMSLIKVLPPYPALKVPRPQRRALRGGHHQRRRRHCPVQDSERAVAERRERP